MIQYVDSAIPVDFVEAEGMCHIVINDVIS